MKIFAILTLILSPILVAANDLELKLSFPTTQVKAGASLKAKVTIKNHGYETVHLVTPGEGSDYGLRTPMVGFSSIRISGKKESSNATPLENYVRCRNINSIKENEIFALKPKETEELGNYTGYIRIEKPGTYRIRYYYQNIPDMNLAGIPISRPFYRITEKIKESAAVKLVSNEVMIEVTGEKQRGVHKINLIKHE